MTATETSRLDIGTRIRISDDYQYGGRCGAVVGNEVFIGQWWCPIHRIQGDRIGRAVLAGWGFCGIQPPRYSDERGCVWVRLPDNDGWVAEKGSGKGWLKEALDGAGVPE